MLFPAIGTRIVTNPLAVFEQTIQYLEELGGKVLELSSKGLSTSEIRQQIFGDEHPLAEITQHLASSENLVKSFLKKN